jgi:hypothetical protein
MNLKIFPIKSIIVYCCYFVSIFINFFIISFYSEIEFIKPLDGVKIQRKTITFTKDTYYNTFIH